MRDRTLTIGGATTVALALGLAPGVVPEAMAQPSSDLYVIVDTSRSMRQSDPDHLAALTARLLGDLLTDGAGNTVTLVRLPDMEEICTPTGRHVMCGVARAAERPGMMATSLCDVCNFAPANLETVAADLLARAPTELTAKELTAHLDYLRDASILEPAFDAVALRMEAAPTRPAVVLLVTDGQTEAQPKVPTRRWSASTSEQARWTGALLLGYGARAPRGFAGEHRFTIRQPADLLPAIAAVHGATRQSWHQILRADKDRVRIQVPKGAAALDLVTFGKRPVGFVLPRGVVASRTVRGSASKSMHYGIVTIASPPAGFFEVKLRGAPRASVLALSRFNHRLALESGPPAALAEEPFRVVAHTRVGQTAIALPPGVTAELRLEDDLPFTLPIDSKGRGEQLIASSVPGKRQLIGQLWFGGQLIHQTEPQLLDVRAALDLGTLAAGATRCRPLPYDGLIPALPGIPPALPPGTRVGAVTAAARPDDAGTPMSEQVSWANPTRWWSGNASGLCVSAGLWAPSSVEVNLSLPLVLEDGDRDQPPPEPTTLLVSYQIRRQLGGAHYAVLWPLVLLALPVLFSLGRARRQRWRVLLLGASWLGASALTGWLVALLGPFYDAGSVSLLSAAGMSGCVLMPALILALAPLPIKGAWGEAFAELRAGLRALVPAAKAAAAYVGPRAVTTSRDISQLVITASRELRTSGVAAARRMAEKQRAYLEAEDVDEEDEQNEKERRGEDPTPDAAPVQNTTPEPETKSPALVKPEPLAWNIPLPRRKSAPESGPAPAPVPELMPELAPEAVSEVVPGPPARPPNQPDEDAEPAARAVAAMWDTGIEPKVVTPTPPSTPAPSKPGPGSTGEGG